MEEDLLPPPPPPKQAVLQPRHSSREARRGGQKLGWGNGHVGWARTLSELDGLKLGHRERAGHRAMVGGGGQQLELSPEMMKQDGENVSETKV